MTDTTYSAFRHGKGWASCRRAYIDLRYCIILGEFVEVLGQPMKFRGRARHWILLLALSCVPSSFHQHSLVTQCNALSSAKVAPSIVLRRSFPETDPTDFGQSRANILRGPRGQ